MSESDPGHTVPSKSERDVVVEMPTLSEGSSGMVDAYTETRRWLIGLATLAASMTYQTGLNPPGGFWQDDNGHQAGNPVLLDRVPKRYLTFYYFNVTAFVTSLLIVILLLNKRFYASEARVAALTLTTMVDGVSIFGAYIAGSTADIHSSIYIIVLTCFLLVCILYVARVLPNLCFILLFLAPPLWKLAKKGWLPVTGDLKKRVEAAKMLDSDEEKRKADMNNKTRTNRRCCCSCGRALMHDIEETGQEAA